MITAPKTFYNLVCNLEGWVLITCTSFRKTITIRNSLSSLLYNFVIFCYCLFEGDYWFVGQRFKLSNLCHNQPQIQANCIWMHKVS